MTQKDNKTAYSTHFKFADKFSSYRRSYNPCQGFPSGRGHPISRKSRGGVQRRTESFYAHKLESKSSSLFEAAFGLLYRRCFLFSIDWHELSLNSGPEALYDRGRAPPQYPNGLVSSPRPNISPVRNANGSSNQPPANPTRHRTPRPVRLCTGGISVSQIWVKRFA